MQTENGSCALHLANRGARLGDSKARRLENTLRPHFFANSPTNYQLQREIDLLNPVAPVDFFVSNAGELVTLDNLHNRGYGAALVLYRPNGELVTSYKLSNLFTQKEIASFPMSVSSITWHNGPTYIGVDQKTFYMGYHEPPDYRELIPNLASGSVRFCASIPKYRCWMLKKIECRTDSSNIKLFFLTTARTRSKGQGHA